jgi:hypothetical protein
VFQLLAQVEDKSMKLETFENEGCRDLSAVFAISPKSNPSNDNTPPHHLMCDCPIVARHWFGMETEANQ